MFKKSFQSFKRTSDPLQAYYFADDLKLEDERSLKFFEELIGGLVHKQNNHLTIIEGYSSLLSSNLIDLQMRENALAVSLASSKLAKLNERVTDCIPRNSLSTESFEVLTFLQDLLSEIPEKNSIPQIDLKSPESEVIVKANREGLKNILLEILQNSMQAAFSSVHPQTVSISLLNGVEEGYLGIEIKDTAGGIPASSLKSVFQPFFTTRQKKHSGIGLTRAAILTHRMEGRIGVKSEEKTTSVLVLIPHPGNS